MNERLLGRLPTAFWTVPYAGSRHPGSPAVPELPEPPGLLPALAAGANCQLFAYAVLRHFALAPPELRSSELWADTRATVRVSRARPLDLLLFGATEDAYGAHVGVWADDDQVLHLCAEAGRPAVWSLREFARRERYRVLIGVKRVIRAGTAPVGDTPSDR
ncbi:hydrolase [Streptomyces sp. NPDC020801]|uniref:hydrolase n=1 Tax=unclassified Streptomyces TaxID=2593676 RepID=UPI0037B83211